jgi:hypothetical protein
VPPAVLAAALEVGLPVARGARIGGQPEAEKEEAVAQPAGQTAVGRTAADRTVVESLVGKAPAEEAGPGVIEVAVVPTAVLASDSDHRTQRTVHHTVLGDPVRR